MSEENTSAGSAVVEAIPPDGPVGGVPLAKPIHIQRLEHAVRLDSFLDFVDQCMEEPLLEGKSPEKDKDLEEIGREFVPKTLPNPVIDQGFLSDVKCDQDTVNSDTLAKAERRADKRKFFNFGKVKKNRRWLKAILLSDSSDLEDEEEEDKSLSKNDLREMLRLHKFGRQCKNQVYIESELQQYQYYSAGLLSNYDKFLDHQRTIVGPKKAKKTSSSSKIKEKLKRERDRKELSEDQGEPQMMQECVSDYDGSVAVFQDANRKFTSIKDVDARRKRIWLAIAKRDIPKAHKHRASVHNNILTNCRKMAQGCQKELRRAAIQSQRVCKETPYRARRLTREMMAFWKHYEKVEKEHRRKAEKEAQEQRRIDDEFREAKRTQRKLNFLITQTELYAHFMSRKLTGQGDEERNRILNMLDEKTPKRLRTVKQGLLVDIETDDYDTETMKQRALLNVTHAYNSFENSKNDFDTELHLPQQDSAFSLSTTSMDTEQHPQPSMFRGTLKSYQLKGMNWLINLYDCGINGILADEMGLGKTVQSIAFLAHLAESQGIWGPFLVVAPASTLHNWTQECSRFVPKFRVLPYWGNPQDRKTLRKFWGQSSSVLHTEQAEFHILVTSYQLVVQDIRYFQRIKWHYMILDEAQAIKSSSSVRWRLLLGFNCRNRLLLTGTPIQNSMAELWALLHFIMPTLFDSHEEFNDWFSKDIESHAEKQSGFDEEQLSRLHMILKPFMLRRVKKDVENELSDKIEILMYCQLSTRQRLFYRAIKNKISIEDLFKSHYSTTAQTQTNNLMNLVMQFRKVCNHPELFERRDTSSPFHTHLDEVTLPRLLLQDIIQNQPLRNKVLYHMLSIFTAENIHYSLFGEPRSSPGSSSCGSAFSFSCFVETTPAQLQSLKTGLMASWLLLFLVMKAAYRVYLDGIWKETVNSNRRLLLVRPLCATSQASRSCSPIMQELLFTSWTTTLSSHNTHLFHHMPETGWHKRVRTRTSHTPTPAPAVLSSPQSSSSSSGVLSPLRHKSTSHASPSGAKSPGFTFAGSGKSPSSQGSESPAFKQVSSLIAPRMRPVTVRRCQRTDMPAFLFNTIPKVNAAPVNFYCKDRRETYQLSRLRHGDSIEAMQCVKYGSPEIYQERRSNLLRPPAVGGLCALKPHYGYTKIQIPDKDYLVTDSGKMHVLDDLLSQLKDQGHRVLIYSQMTRMIDILEEFLWHRKHTYMRLDGSSKISDRRDMVAGFQSRTDIFVFLLSTRAGGLGINLTAADTVIFYDSDWNPTVDQQAMDRAHRLGQTKQVTVYRLICKGTIEEHILERAREKSEIQRMVISGGHFKLEQLKPKEVVSLLLDDEDIEMKFRMKQSEKKSPDDRPQSKERKRKRDKDGESVKEGGKKVKTEVISDTANVSLDGDDSILSVDSAAPSPVSVVSVGSESNHARSLSLTPVPQDENSNDGLLIVDEASPSQSIEGDDTSPAGKSRAGVGRGMRTKQSPGAVKKTSQRIGRPRKGIAAAAMAGARAGAVAGTAAAYAAYGFNLVGKQESSSPASTTPPPSIATSEGLTSPSASTESIAGSTTSPPAKKQVFEVQATGIPEPTQDRGGTKTGDSKPQEECSASDAKVGTKTSPKQEKSASLLSNSDGTLVKNSPPKASSPGKVSLQVRPSEGTVHALRKSPDLGKELTMTKGHTQNKSILSVVSNLKAADQERMAYHISLAKSDGLSPPKESHPNPISLVKNASGQIPTSALLEESKLMVTSDPESTTSLGNAIQHKKPDNFVTVTTESQKQPGTLSMHSLKLEKQAQMSSMLQQSKPQTIGQSGELAMTSPPKSPVQYSPRRAKSPISSFYRSESPGSSGHRSKSPVSDAYNSKSPVVSVHGSKSPVNSAHGSKSPVNSAHRSKSPVSSTLGSSTAPGSNALSSKSPVSPAHGSKSPVSATLISKSPVSSTYRSKSPVSAKSPVSPAHGSKSPVSPTLISKSPVSSTHRSKSPVSAKSPVSPAHGSKSPVSATQSSKFPLGLNANSKSPSHKSPGRQSPGQVVPLDLRSKPVVTKPSATSTGPPTTIQNSS
eukprot:XP_795650.4 PREDICTED: DNA helicase INO80 [Strongylocentrotus purpuratus]